uniref:Synaptonemal complex central element protein 1 isoform X3 n=1 Tax=Pogona vitticeps TaxID=103695 RepID=A0ABM5FPT6_9SAUR
MEEILSLVKQMQNVGNLEPRIEELVKRINKLQQAKKLLSKELSEANEHSETLQKELEKLNAEKLTLEETWNEKKETLRVMQLHCEEAEAKMQRQQQLNQECKQRIEAITAQIQEEKLKQSEQRMEFEQLLDELMEKHKSLWELYAREKQVAEMKDSKERLLSEGSYFKKKIRKQNSIWKLPHSATLICSRDVIGSCELKSSFWHQEKFLSLWSASQSILVSHVLINCY